MSRSGLRPAALGALWFGMLHGAASGCAAKDELPKTYTVTGTAVLKKDQPAPSAMQSFLQPPAEYEGKLGDYRSVMKFDDGTPVRTAQDWVQRRAEILKYWHDVMGAWPALVEKPEIKYQEKEHIKNFTRHEVQVEMTPGRLLGPQYLLIPDGPGPFPAVLVTWYGSADSAGLNPEWRDTLDFGYQLAQRGFVTLCIGGSGVGPEDGQAADRKSGIQPLSYLAYVAANCRNALASLPQVDPERIGVMGHSFGGKWAMFASCLDEKFACAVWVDPGIVWNEKDPNANYWEKWYLGYEFDQQAERQRREGIVTLDNPRTGAYKRLVADGRDMHELHALMAPRPFLVSGGAQDRPEHWTALNHTVALNKLLGYTGRVGMTMRDGHTPTPESNRQAFSFLEHFLASTPAASSGIASEYPGDEGIERDPRVLFADDFETGDIRDIVARWGNGHEDGRVAVSDEVRDGAPGGRSVHIKFGHLYTHFKPSDQVHVRYYMKFHPEFGYPHHLPFLIADRVPTPWPKGFAGKKPAGDMFFGTAFDTYSEWGKLPPPGKWMLYTYWQEMQPDGLGKYWGNNLVPPQEHLIERGRWYCLEMMIKANSRPDIADGEQKFWVDGKLVGEFKGFRWRSTDKLKLNSFWLLHDGETGSSISNDPDHAKRQYDVWFDDLVIATEYIGPVQGTPKAGKKIGVPSRSALETPGLVLAKPGKVVFKEDFDGESPRFRGGKVAQGGVDDSKAFEFPRAGADTFHQFETTVQDSTTIRFKLKPLADVTEAQLLVWSAELEDNVRIHLSGLKKGQWTEFEIRALDLRVGYDGQGDGLDGKLLDNLKIVFDGPPEARVLLDDVEVRE